MPRSVISVYELLDMMEEDFSQGHPKEWMNIRYKYMVILETMKVIKTKQMPRDKTECPIKLTKSTGWATFCSKEIEQKDDIGDTWYQTRGELGDKWGKLPEAEKKSYEDMATEENKLRLARWREAMCKIPKKTPAEIKADIESPKDIVLPSFKKDKLHLLLGQLGKVDGIDASTSKKDLQKLLVLELYGQYACDMLFGRKRAYKKREKKGTGGTPPASAAQSSEEDEDDDDSQKTSLDEESLQKMKKPLLQQLLKDKGVKFDSKATKPRLIKLYATSMELD